MPELETTYAKAWRLRQAMDGIIVSLERAEYLKQLKYAEAAPLAIKIEADAESQLSAVEKEISEVAK